MNNKCFKRKRRVDTNIKYHLDSWTCWTYLLCFNIRLYRFLCKWQPKINCWSETTVNHYYSNFNDSSINFQYNLIYYLEFNNKNSCLALKINNIKHKNIYFSIFHFSFVVKIIFLTEIPNLNQSLYCGFNNCSSSFYSMAFHFWILLFIDFELMTTHFPIS